MARWVEANGAPDSFSCRSTQSQAQQGRHFVGRPIKPYDSEALGAAASLAGASRAARHGIDQNWPATAEPLGALGDYSYGNRKGHVYPNPNQIASSAQAYATASQYKRVGEQDQMQTFESQVHWVAQQAAALQRQYAQNH